jgi:hypothetical protein
MVAERAERLGESISGGEEALTASTGVTTEVATERWISELRGLMWKYAGLCGTPTGSVRRSAAVRAGGEHAARATRA